MKRLKFLAFVGAAVMAIVGCNKKDINSLKDDVSDLKTRVTVLEELCKQNNTNINSLQTIVNAASSQNDYITSVTPITKEGVEIGYTIAFAKQAAITIYHGTNGTNGVNGENGTDGEDGATPIIGVKQFTDGVYYWTLNGEWLLDDSNQMLRVSGKDGVDGTNGTDGEKGEQGEAGTNGNDGQDGVTPKLKVEDGNWFVSYNNGETWTYVAQATGDKGEKGDTGETGATGEKGEKGDQGDSMFKSVTYDDNYVYFTLADETMLKVAKAQGIVTIEKGAIKAAFSVAANRTVYFSQGNLQYKASTGVWRFAPNQYDVIGEANANIASDYSGWIDLFGWGTSGWNSGATAYMPYATNTANNAYYPGGSYENNLTGEYANADWGVYNKIANGGNEAGLWRVLTKDEWVYLFKSRVNAASKYGIATVNGVNGLIILPDSWILPECLTFNSGTANADDADLYQTINNYSLAQWTKLEEHGAIFLPAGGYRIGATVYRFGRDCSYWSSTAKDADYAYPLYFSSSFVNPSDDDYRRTARCVRLVCVVTE